MKTTFVCKRLFFIFQYAHLYSWFATTWQGGHVGGQNKRIFPRRIYMKIEFSSQRRENVFVLDHQHGRRDVTCKPAIVLKIIWAALYSIYFLNTWGLHRKCHMERKERIKAIWVAEQHVPTRTDCRFCDIDESNKKAPVLLSWIRSHATVQNVCNYRLSSPLILGWAGIQTLNRFPCSNWGFWNCYRTIK